MNELITHRPGPEIDQTLEALANRYRRAGGIGIDMLNLVGGQAENLLERLPDPIKNRLDDAAERALHAAFKLAQQSRGGRIPDGLGWQNTVLTGVMGAAGGMGGLPSALAEVPMTTTVLLRAIQGISVRHGFDPLQPEVRAAAVQVFAAAGPLSHDDGADLGFLATRMTLTGPALSKVISRVAPRLATAMGHKLAAQSVPILGAVAGAVTNVTYTRYYQEIAEVQFGLMALSRDSGADLGDLTQSLRDSLADQPPIRRA